jgi:pSer/pThr/pTyr-binding forkhead associated (FHA) protein
LRSDDGEVILEYPLDKAEIRIGRAPDSDILLSKDKLTSRRHATVHYENNQYILQDERSANGTFINGQQIEEMVPQTLHNGDHIGIGEHELIFRAYDSPAEDIESLNTVAVPFNAAPAENTFRTRQDDNATLATSQGDDFRTQEALEDQVPATPKPEMQPQQPAIASQPESIPAAPAITSYSYEPAPQSEPVASQPVAPYEKAESAVPSMVLREQDSEVVQKRQYYVDTLKAYEDAIMRDSSDSTAYLGMGNVCYALQRYAAALDAFQQAIRLHPTATAWAGRGNVFAELYLYQQAVEAYEEALRLDDTVTLDYDALVQSLMALGRVEEAERYRERARELGYYDE